MQLWTVVKDIDQYAQSMLLWTVIKDASQYGRDTGVRVLYSVMQKAGLYVYKNQHFLPILNIWKNSVIYHFWQTLNTFTTKLFLWINL
jgi:hypothetical protein